MVVADGIRSAIPRPLRIRMLQAHRPIPLTTTHSHEHVPAEALPSDEAELITPEQLARKLNLTRRCLSNWSRAGEFLHIQQAVEGLGLG